MDQTTLLLVPKYCLPSVKYQNNQSRNEEPQQASSKSPIYNLDGLQNDSTVFLYILRLAGTMQHPKISNIKQQY